MYASGPRRRRDRRRRGARPDRRRRRRSTRIVARRAGRATPAPVARVSRRQDQDVRLPRRPGDEGRRPARPIPRGSTRASAACSIGRSAAVIEAQHVSKMYSRGVYALRDLSLRIDKGEFVFLTGPSGAGKSTLLRLLLRQDVPTEGRLVVGGRDLSQALRRARSRPTADRSASSSRISSCCRPRPCSRTSRSCRACSAWPRRSSSGARSRC